MEADGWEIKMKKEKEFIELNEIDYCDSNYIRKIKLRKSEISEYGDSESTFILGNDLLGQAKHGVIQMCNGNSYSVSETKELIDDKLCQK